MMPIRIPWNKYEVVLLIDAYLRIQEGSDFSKTAEMLSATLRFLANSRGVEID